MVEHAEIDYIGPFVTADRPASAGPIASRLMDNGASSMSGPQSPLPDFRTMAGGQPARIAIRGDSAGSFTALSVLAEPVTVPHLPWALGKNPEQMAPPSLPRWGGLGWGTL